MHASFCEQCRFDFVTGSPAAFAPPQQQQPGPAGPPPAQGGYGYPQPPQQPHPQQAHPQQQPAQPGPPPPGPQQPGPGGYGYPPQGGPPMPPQPGPVPDQGGYGYPQQPQAPQQQGVPGPGPQAPPAPPHGGPQQSPPSGDWTLPPPGAPAQDGYGYPQQPQPPQQHQAQPPQQQHPQQAYPQQQPPQPGPPQPGLWTAVVAPDREYFTAMMHRSGPEATALNLPAYSAEHELPLTGHQISIGRRRNSTGEAPDIDLGRTPEDPGVSHQHALLIAQPDGSWSVVDQNSTNGTTVNGGEDPIQPYVPIPLQDGDQVHVGAWTTITVRLG